MVRKTRTWLPYVFYHIVSRGNRKEVLFYDEEDFETFFYILQTVREKAPFELASYCLMPNHFHLQLRSQIQPISKLMFFIKKRYADYFNNKYEMTGHVFEKRFFDDAIPSQLKMLKISQYIHLNPVEAGMVRRPEDYRWSSYRYYVRLGSHPLLQVKPILEIFEGSQLEQRQAYQKFVEEKVPGTCRNLSNTVKGN